MLSRTGIVHLYTFFVSSSLLIEVAAKIARVAIPLACLGTERTATAEIGEDRSAYPTVAKKMSAILLLAREHGSSAVAGNDFL